GRVKWERISKIMALVPPENAVSSDSSSSSDEEVDIPLHTSTQIPPIIQDDSDASSEPHSIPSSLERFNLLDSSDEERDQPQASSCNISNIQCIPATPVITQLLQDSNPLTLLPQLHSLSSLLSPHPSPAQQTRSKRKAIIAPIPKQKKKKYVPKPLSFDWKLTKFKHRAEVEAVTFSTPYDPALKSPSDYFLTLFTENIIQMIADETNLYSVQTSETNKCINMTCNDIRDFLALTLMMGVVGMPAYRDYWSNEFRFPPIADVMSLRKYETIRRHLHFVDNNDTNEDRFFKIRPLLEQVRQNCLKIEEEGRYSIDEMMIPYKGTRAGSRRQYMPKKPKKWGFKMFVRAGVSGIVYDFLPYAGEDTFRFYAFNDYEGSLGLGAKVVLALSKTITTKPSIVYFDNFFTSLELIRYLRQELGIFSLGTIRNNRLRGCQEKFPTDKQFSKTKRGTSKQVVCQKNRLAIVKWHDNKVVTLASSFVDSHPVETIQRYCKDAKTKIVKQYNVHMGGVDLADMLVALYRSNMKTKRWYMAIFRQILDICVNNAWLLYRRNTATKKVPLKKFRLQIAAELLKKNRTKNINQHFNVPQPEIRTPAAPRPPIGVRYDNIGHFPGFTGIQGR
ncbi:hypothetical protein MSG28_003575, partial [Choristoneura fumiferana]